MNPDAVSAIGSISSTVVAIFAVWIAYISWRTSTDATRANAVLAEIERKRLYVEMHPQIEVELERVATSAATLTVRLAGPMGIEWIDVTANLRPQAPHYGDGTTVAPWIFYELGDHWISETEAATFRLVPGDEQWLYMETTPNVSEFDLRHQRVRLWLKCINSSGEKWLIPASAELFDPLTADETDD